MNLTGNSKNQLSRTRIVFPAILIVFSAVLYLAGLGDLPLWDTDETLYTRIAQEMEITGDYLTTQWNFTPWFCHPPLYFWMTALTAKFFGWTAFAARFPSALFGIFNVLLVYYLGRHLYNEKTGFYAGLIFAVTLHIWLQSRFAILDMPFLFFITAALYAYFRALENNHKGWITAFWFSGGMAVLAKGPVGFALPLIYICFYICADDLAEAVKKAKQEGTNLWKGIGESIKKALVRHIPLLYWPAILLFLVISVSWYALMSNVYGQDFNEQVFGYFFFTRIVAPVMDQGGEWWYYFPFFLSGFLPWSPLLPLIFYYLYRNRNDKRALFLTLFIVLIFIMFSAAGTKRPNYLLFIYPAISIALGAALYEGFDDGKFKRALRLSFLTSGIIGLFLGLVVAYVGLTFYPQYWMEYKGVLTPLAVAVGVGSIAVIVTSGKKKGIPFYCIVAAITVSFFIINTFAPVIGGLRPELKIPAILNEIKKPGDTLIIRSNFGSGYSTFFYSNMPMYVYQESIYEKSINSPEFDKRDLIDLLRLTSRLQKPENLAQEKVREFFVQKGLFYQPLSESGQVSDGVTEQIISGLNELLKKKDFYDEKSFKEIEYGSEAARLISEGPSKLEEADLASLNRLLLEAAFPQSIAKSWIIAMVADASGRGDSYVLMYTKEFDAYRPFIHYEYRLVEKNSNLTLFRIGKEK